MRLLVGSARTLRRSRTVERAEEAIDPYIRMEGAIPRPLCQDTNRHSRSQVGWRAPKLGAMHLLGGPMSKSNHSKRIAGQARRVAGMAVAAASLTAALAAAAGAQRTAPASSKEIDSRWLPWVGCWDRGTDRAAQNQ